jgi:hypothetical protein
VNPRADLDDVEMRKISPLQGLELRPVGRPVRSQSLYRLSCLSLQTISENGYWSMGIFVYWYISLWVIWAIGMICYGYIGLLL